MSDLGEIVRRLEILEDKLDRIIELLEGDPIASAFSHIHERARERK